VRSKLRIGFVAAGALCAIAAVAIAGGSLAGAAKPDLEQKIASAEDEASLISNRISSQSARIAELQAQADAADAREQQLLAQLEEATARSTALNDDLLTAEAELEEVTARYDRAIGVLSQRLVAIYKDSEPDVLTVILEADGYEELNARGEYLEALTDADEAIAERVSTLREQVDSTYQEIAGLKAGIDEQARKLEESRSEVEALRAQAKQRSEEIAAAKSDAEAALSELQQKISGWELEVRKQAAEAIGEGGEAYLGGPYSIPTYIVMCESGGNYRALNRSSMAGGAYQIIPSTWAAYGGKGQYAHLASKAEQDRIAAIIWREDGPGAWSCA
jgi:septal ring factor EnvC (AmiA/AmiB activator)